MAGYVIGSEAWLNFLKEQIITSGDLLAHQKGLNLSDEEVESIYKKHVQCIVQLFDYTEQTTK